jgi:hypothetical protein
MANHRSGTMPYEDLPIIQRWKQIYDALMADPRMKMQPKMQVMKLAALLAG